MAHLVITLYDPETNEAVKEFTRTFVPWKLLKRAVKLSKNLEKLDIANLDESIVDELGALVVDAFGSQFTMDQLENGADIGEMMNVLVAIIASTGGNVPNPPPHPHPASP